MTKIKLPIFIIICLSFIFFLVLYQNVIDMTVEKVEEYCVLPQTFDAGEEYIKKIYFVGDSTTYHFRKAGIEDSHILVPESYTLKLASDITSVRVGKNKQTIAEALQYMAAEIVIITIGVNGADSFSETQYKTYYTKLINAIKENSPHTVIIIQSVFPVTKAYSEQNMGITNSGIDRINSWAMSLALENKILYLDTQSILKNDDGAQKEEYSEADGVHMNSKAYFAIIEYIRTHAVNGEKYE